MKTIIKSFIVFLLAGLFVYLCCVFVTMNWTTTENQRILILMGALVAGWAVIVNDRVLDNL